MNTVIWILQGLIAVMFAMAGFMKISKPKEELKKQSSMAWVSNVSSSNLKMIGALALHLRRGDGPQALVPNVILLLIAAFVAYGRFVLVPV